MLRFRHAFLRCFVLALLGLPGLGHAFTACVHTAQELDTAFSQATASTDASITIKIHKGIYAAGAGVSFYLNLAHSNQTATVSGGWDGDACENRVFGADGTVLTGTSGLAALHLSPGLSTTGNTINATDLTLRNDEGILNDSVGACLHVGTNPGATARVYRMRLDSCVGASAAILQNFGSNLVFANSVVVGGFNSDAPVRSITNNAVTHLAHLTITGNTTTSAGQPASGLSVISQISQVVVENSIIWGSLAPDGIPDVATDGAGVSLARVHYGTRSFVNGTVSDTDPSHGDPGLASPTNPRPRIDSPLVDSGVETATGGLRDVTGDTRTQGSAVDVGAYETNPDRLFADGLDH